MFFVRSAYKDILVESLNYCVENKGLVVYGWVIMTSHVHLIIGTKQEPMQNIVCDLKKYTSKAIVQAIRENARESRREWMLWMLERAGKKKGNNTNFQFWQQNNHSIELSDTKLTGKAFTSFLSTSQAPRKQVLCHWLRSLVLYSTLVATRS